MTETKNLMLQKPEPNDPADINKLNVNWDIVDENIGAMSKLIKRTVLYSVGAYTITPQVAGVSVGVGISVNPPIDADAWRLFVGETDISGKVAINKTFTTAPAIFENDNITIALEKGGKTLYVTELSPESDAGGTISITATAAIDAVVNGSNKAADAAKLGGQLPEYYAKQQDMQSAAQILQTVSAALDDKANDAEVVKKATGLPNSLILKMNGSTSTFKGTSVVSKTWYAPTTAGAAGQILKSNGSGAPVWGTETPQKNVFITVAASTAPDDVKASADYVCDGVADDVEINAALKQKLNTNSSESQGKIVLLSTGTFNITKTIEITGAEATTPYPGGGSHTLMGAGNGTIIKRNFAGKTTRPHSINLDSGAMISLHPANTEGRDCCICNLVMDCGYDEFYDADTSPYIDGISYHRIGSKIIVDNVCFKNYETAIFALYGNINITNCTFVASHTGCYAFKSLQDANGKLHLEFNSNSANGNVIDIKLSDRNGTSSGDSTTNSSEIYITKSTFNYIDIQGYNLAGTSLKGTKVFLLNNTYSGFNYNYTIKDVYCLILANNIISYGQCLTNNTFCLVCNNIVEYIPIKGTSGAVVCGNIFNASNTSFHGILLANTTKNCIVANNVLSGTAVITDSGSGNVLKDNVIRSEE